MIECKAPCRDKQFWKNPKNFNPDRFIGLDGEQKLPQGCFMPYGAGILLIWARTLVLSEF